MLSEQSKHVAAKARSLYLNQLKAPLESEHYGEFVCIEPQSGDDSLGETFDAAVNRAIDAYPNRLTHTLRVGHAAAIHLGVLTQ